MSNSVTQRLRGAHLAVVIALLAGLAWPAWNAWQRAGGLPPGIEATYVGNKSCSSCHLFQFERWQGSDHDLAMDVAAPKTMLGDFNNAVFEHEGAKSRFFTADDKYFVETNGPEGKPGVFELKYTFGVRPLQQYLTELSQGRIHALPIAWDVSKKCWFYVPEDKNIQAHEAVYWTNRGGNWNYMCADCHSTDLKKNYNPEANDYHTTWNEIDVSCEACHGPASIHLDIVRRGAKRDPRYGMGIVSLKSPSATVPNFRDPGPGKKQIDACGQCHARRQFLAPGFRPGNDFFDFFEPEVLDSESYFPDGQIREENYEYGSFHFSLMHAKGVKCTDCHDPHTARLTKPGNALCVQCHIAGKYDTPSHHFHKPESTGAKCVECHMPETTYMKVDARRDHSFHVPRPDLTLSLNIPNACNKCHADKSAEWSNNHVKIWYKRRDWPARWDFAEAIAGGRKADPKAADGLVRLVRDGSVPPAIRGSAVSLLRNYPVDKSKPILEMALKDSSPLVRVFGVRLAEQSLGLVGRRRDDPEAPSLDDAGIKRLAAMLEDSSRLVRMETARVLAPAPRAILSSEMLEAFDRELKGYIDRMMYLSDDPSSNHNLGNLYTAMNEPALAEKSYLRALDRDPSFGAARFNLAMLYYNQDRKEDALSTFAEVVKFAERETKSPDPIVVKVHVDMLTQTHYSMGLLLAEDRAKVGDAVVHLEKAASLDPTLDRIHYNLGRAHQIMNEWEKAERSFATAMRAKPDDMEYAAALAEVYAERGKTAEAIKLLRVVTEREPANLAALSLLRRLQAQEK